MCNSTERGRIAYLCLEAPREGQASHVHMNEIVRGLRTLGWVVDVFAPAYSNRWLRPPLMMRLIEQCRLQFGLIRRMADYRIIYVRSHPIAWFTSLAARLFRTPVVQEVNGTFDDLYLAFPAARVLRRLIDAIMRQQYRLSAAMIAVTPGIARWLEGETGPGSPQITLVTNGANPDLFRPDLVSEDLQLDGPYVIFVGSQAPWHDIDVILDAVSLPDWPSEVKLILAGDCADAERAKRLARQDPRLVLLGRLAYERVGCVLAGSLAGIIAIGDPGGRSSSTGVAPLKLFETMACGVPVIASSLPFQAEIVTDIGAGVLYPPGDPTALAKAVGQLAGNPELAAQMGRRGRAAVLKDHSWQIRSAETDALLRQIILHNR